VLNPSPSCPSKCSMDGNGGKDDHLAAERLCLGVQPAGQLQEDPFMGV